MRPRGRSLRHPATKIALFNHKGGVGKTVITANVCFALSELGFSVLAVDADPQCNLSTYLLKSSELERMLDQSDDNEGQTLWSAVRPILDGTGGVATVKAVSTAVRNVSLLTGDLRLARFEESLAYSWPSIWSRSLHAVNQFTALCRIVSAAAQATRADFVFYDVGPNIGTLNRCVLLDCDYYVVPVLKDVFSRRALGTLARTISTWTAEWEQLGALLPDWAAVLRGRPALAGYVVGDYSSYPGASRSYELSQIQTEVSTRLVSVLSGAAKPKRRSLASYNLGTVSNYGEVVNSAIESNSSIWRIPSKTSSRAANEFRSLAMRIAEEVSLAR